MKLLYSVFFLLIVFGTVPVSAQNKTESGSITVEEKVKLLDFAEARSAAVSKAQATILKNYLASSLPPGTTDYFSGYIEEKVLTFASDYFLSVNISDEEKTNGFFKLTLEGTFDVDKLTGKIEEIGLPVFSGDKLNVILISVGPNGIVLANHLKKLGFGQVKLLLRDSFIEPDQIIKEFESNPNAAAIYQIESRNSSPTEKNYTMRVHIRNTGGGYSQSIFSVVTDPKNNTQEAFVGKLTLNINRNTLKIQTVAQLGSKEKALEITGFDNLTSLMTFVDFLMSPKGIELFGPSSLRSVTQKSVRLGVKTSNFSGWLQSVNSRANIFKLSVTGGSESKVTLRYQNLLQTKETTVLPKISQESNYSYFYEQEDNNSLYSYNRSPTKQPVYGNIGNSRDTDVYLISDPIISQLQVRSTQKTGKDLSVKIADKDGNFIKKFIIDDGKDQKINLAEFDLRDGMFLLISQNAPTTSLNIGAQRPLEYMFQVN